MERSQDQPFDSKWNLVRNLILHAVLFQNYLHCDEGAGCIDQGFLLRGVIVQTYQNEMKSQGYQNKTCETKIRIFCASFDLVTPNTFQIFPVAFFQ